MTNVKTVMVRNHRNRVYNGIKYMQIVTVALANIDQYLTAGFLEFDPETGKSIDPKADETAEDLGDLAPTQVLPTREEAFAYLESINVSTPKNIGDAKLFEKALANGWSAQPASKEINDDGLDALKDLEDGDDTTTVVDTETAEDLGDLADGEDEEDDEPTA